MKKQLFTIICMIFFGIPAFSQALYQEAIPTVNQTPQVEVKTVTPAVSITPPPLPLPKSDRYRRLSFNFASVMLTGDLRLGYEIFDTAYRSWNIEFHMNPHDAHTKRTGKYGAIGGMRVYLDPQYQHFYGQLLGGLNANRSDQWHVLLDLSLGYIVEWRKDLLMTTGIGVQRSYDSGSHAPEIYAIVQLTFGVRHHLLPL